MTVKQNRKEKGKKTEKEKGCCEKKDKGGNRGWAVVRDSQKNGEALCL